MKGGSQQITNRHSDHVVMDADKIPNGLGIAEIEGMDRMVLNQPKGDASLGVPQ